MYLAASSRRFLNERKATPGPANGEPCKDPIPSLLKYVTSHQNKPCCCQLHKLTADVNSMIFEQYEVLT